MKKLKDVVAISLVFAMAFSLIGCGKAREKADEDDETEVDEEASVDGMKDLIRDFPGIADRHQNFLQSIFQQLSLINRYIKILHQQNI